MGLTGEEAKESALHTVSAYERRGPENADYWQLRERKWADGSVAEKYTIPFPDRAQIMRFATIAIEGWDSDTGFEVEMTVTQDLH